MWKNLSSPDAKDGQRLLKVVQGKNADISSLFGDKPVAVAARKIRTTHPRPSGTGKDGLLASPPAEWTEQAVYEFLGKARKKVPQLEEVLEMHVRVCGGHRFLCKFLNANCDACIVWVGDGQFARVYPNEYAKSKLRFAAMVNR